MIISYLEKLQNEYLNENSEIEKDINDLKIHLRETTEFIKLLEENSDPNYESFTPREVNSKNKVKIRELQDEQHKIEESLQYKEAQLAECQKKLEELTAVLDEAKKEVFPTDSDSGKTEYNDEVFRIKLLETQENERKRISRELHDSTVQNLTSLVHKTEFCSKLVDMDPIRCKLELNMMSKTLREIINDTRQMIYNLRPMSFDDIGLDVTIERALENANRAFDAAFENRKVNFTVEGEPYSIKPVIGITLLRIIQEGCSNAIRHGDASIIQVVLRYEKNKISVKIEDDGKGFEMSSVDRNSRDDNSGFGLSMMKERVYLLSGDISIESTIDCGTKIVVEVPIKNKEEV